MRRDSFRFTAWVSCRPAALNRK